MHAPSCFETKPVSRSFVLMVEEQFKTENLTSPNLTEKAYHQESTMRNRSTLPPQVLLDLPSSPELLTRAKVLGTVATQVMPCLVT